MKASCDERRDQRADDVLAARPLVVGPGVNRVRHPAHVVRVQGPRPRPPPPPRAPRLRRVRQQQREFDELVAVGGGRPGVGRRRPRGSAARPRPRPLLFPHPHWAWRVSTMRRPSARRRPRASAKAPWMAALLGCRPLARSCASSRTRLSILALRISSGDASRPVVTARTASSRPTLVQLQARRDAAEEHLAVVKAWKVRIMEMWRLEDLERRAAGVQEPALQGGGERVRQLQAARRRGDGGSQVVEGAARARPRQHNVRSTPRCAGPRGGRERGLGSALDVGGG